VSQESQATTTSTTTNANPHLRWWALGAMCSSLAMVMLDTTAVNVALPSIQRTFHATTITIQWVINSYTLALAVFLIVGGRLGDLFGRRRLFLCGVSIFIVASAAIGLAPTAGWVLAWRAVQGTGAALMLPATIAIITDLFPPEERGKAIGIWTGVSGIALALGPVAGGLLSTSVSWRLIFYLNLPIAIAAFIVTRLVVRESRDLSSTRGIDVPGVLALTVGLFALTFGLVKVIGWHVGSPREIALFVVAAVSLCAFIWIERRSRAPMIAPNLFRSPMFVGSLVVVFILMFTLFGTQLYLSLYMQNIRLYSPLAAGVRFMPSMGAFIFASPIGGRLTDRFGPRPVVCAGLLVIAGSAIEASFVTVTSGYWVLLIGLVLLGFGLGLALTSSSTAGINAVSQDKAGVAGGVLSTSRMVGGVFGVVVLGVLMLDIATMKLNHLAPFLPPGSALKLANNPPTRHVLELAPTEFLFKVRYSFVYALQHMLRAAAILPLFGAGLTLILMRPRHGLAKGQVSSPATSDPLTQAMPQHARVLATSELDQ
jgi:EmrB/QacA subfamily drug resistance transporter